ncbi:hypothetical protein D0469_03525 [Peribacillus saganii]|uniref:Uncharacterized protein n=1 Tax=Peribacillus saganii TaxID=2303992 RepID=A0A372LS64_9BACI|nr:hypothetical protein [Peribacillus saganii]RFU71023.1 hypothetical protein D0469_03525 [Peribacillus saganii]
MRKFRVYYKHAGGMIGVGIEEMEQINGRGHIAAIASVFIPESLSDIEIVSRLIDICGVGQDESFVLKLSRTLPTPTMDRLRSKHPNVIFKRTNFRSQATSKELCHDALTRKTTVIERLNHEGTGRCDDL